MRSSRTLPALDVSPAAMLAVQQEEAQASAATEAARDNLVRAQWKYHYALPGAGEQVSAQ